MQLIFKADLKKFGSKGEKTGWTYIEIPLKVSEGLKPGVKKSFRVKGTIDGFAIEKTALIPMGEGHFIMAINATMRKGIKKIAGAEVRVALEADEASMKIYPPFIACLKDEPAAWKHFSSLPESHKQYYSKWITSAKTDATRIKRIAMAVSGLVRKMEYGAMLKEERDNKLIR